MSDEQKDTRYFLLITHHSSLITSSRVRFVRGLSFFR